MKSMNHKRVLITGAAQGLGRALAEEFAAAGAETIVTDIDHQRITETIEDFRTNGYRASGYVMDVTNPEAIRDVRNQLMADSGPVDVVINNAGIVHGGRFIDVGLERHRAIYEINVLGVVNVTHVFLPDLIASSDSHLINIGSASGMLPLPHAASYASSKSAVYGFSESIREELRVAGHGHVHVTAVCPSYLSTELFSGVKLPRFTKVLTPERLARKVLRAVLQNRDLVLAPWLVNLVPMANGFVPRAVFRWLRDWLGINSGMITWCGPENEPAKSQNEITPLKNKRELSVPVLVSQESSGPPPGPRGVWGAK